MIQRTGEVVLHMLGNVQQATIAPFIKTTIALGTTVYTDEYDIYSRLPEWGDKQLTGSKSMLATTTTMGFAKSTSTRGKASGRCCGLG